MISGGSPDTSVLADAFQTGLCLVGRTVRRITDAKRAVGRQKALFMELPTLGGCGWSFRFWTPGGGEQQQGDVKVSEAHRMTL